MMDPAAAAKRALEKKPYPGARIIRGDVTAKALGDDPIPADAHLKGMWSPVVDWPLIAIHAVLLPDGRVLSYGTNPEGKQTAAFNYDVWTPSAGFGSSAHRVLPNQTNVDLFCGSQLVLPQAGAGVLFSGGDWTENGVSQNWGNWFSAIFNYQTNTLGRGNDMVSSRWYSTSTTLLNGEVLIMGGAGGTARPEVRNVNGVFRQLSGADTSPYSFFYPRNFIAPSGRVFGYDVDGKMYSLDPSGTGSIQSHGQFQSAYAGDMSTAAMFRPGQILQFNGNSAGAIVIDVTGATPVVTPTQSMSSNRKLLTGTLLPDGKVLATGGSSVYNELTGAALHPEMWNPQTGAWTSGAEGALPRLYHSSALLLPDASVLVAGGGAPGPLVNLNAEIYYPPYLFKSNGTLAPRPGIGASPSTVQVGRSFTVDVNAPGGIGRVVLVKTGSVTHGWNMEQRFIELAFAASGSSLTVQMSSRASDTPPGYYLLFVLDPAGVPSVGKVVWINVAGATAPQNAPVVVNPGNRTGVAGTAVSFAVQASDADGDALSFSASGLPPGVSISSGGMVSGAPSTAGSYGVTIAASDGAASGSASFTWTVTAPVALEIDPMPAATPTQAGTDVSFTAAARGDGVRYRWNFGDGSPDTAYATSPTVTHRFTRPGIYYVTVTVMNSAGSQQARSFMQMVHLPLTARAATQSSSLAYETRTGAAARVWMVNPDNDSVTAFDASNGQRLAEVVTATSPRSVAVDAAGRIWVTSKLFHSYVHVIDPATLAVTRTLLMPRVSQPHGIAMSPDGAFAYIVLEATGEVVKYRTSDYAKVAAAKVGARVRNVSVSPDGTTLYVARFVTSPQPGESTTTVTTTSGGVPTGGEVLRLRASDLVRLGTVVLRFGAQPDAEDRGRGVPNYLGAMAISPDGSQARVPSKQDNIQRGTRRDGQDLNFQNTVRAISSRIDMATGAEDFTRRIDHDNSGLATAAAFDPLGVLLFVALETSREVAVVDAHGGREMFRFEVGRAPQGLAVSPDGRRLYVNNFMDRTLGVYDLAPLLDAGELRVARVTVTPSVATEKLTLQVLAGKQFFYDARDTRLARDRYMSCASCHADGGEDGRVWDFSGAGEGLRNTIALQGRAGLGHGRLHWSNNFDEVQDFEGQIRKLSGGAGLMNDTLFLAGTRAQPLGSSKTGLSTDLDALAAYVSSLSNVDFTPFRLSGTAMTAQASAGKEVFERHRCGTCHAGYAFTGSGSNTWVDVGTLKPASGMRLAGALNGIDVPTLRDVWTTAPYLHDGSQPTLEGAITAHRDQQSFNGGELADLVAYVRSIGREELAPAIPNGTGSGLRGEYFNNVTFSPPVVLSRTEPIEFSWHAAPGPGVNADGFSVRWSGWLTAPATGSYRFQVTANDRVKFLLADAVMVDKATTNGATITNTSAPINLVTGVRYRVVVELTDAAGLASARLRWITPGNAAVSILPASHLSPN